MSRYSGNLGAQLCWFPVSYLVSYFRQDVHQPLQGLMMGPELHSIDTRVLAWAADSKTHPASRGWGAVCKRPFSVREACLPSRCYLQKHADYRQPVLPHGGCLVIFIFRGIPVNQMELKQGRKRMLTHRSHTALRPAHPWVMPLSHGYTKCWWPESLEHLKHRLQELRITEGRKEEDS